jgi:XTP/dITP diphosphohydrolase
MYYDGQREVVAEGLTSGVLVLPPRGTEGFGWDPVFEPEGSSRTYGEMTAGEKDAISHRGRAWVAFRAALADSRAG